MTNEYQVTKRFIQNANLYGFFSSFFGESSSTMLFGSFHANATYLVWLPLANTSPLLLEKSMEVNAKVLPTAISVS
jgi:hypothetical protein